MGKNKCDKILIENVEEKKMGIEEMFTWISI